MLTFGHAKASALSLSAVRIGARFCAVVTLSVVTWTSVKAEGLVIGSCVRGAGALDCVTRFGAPQDPYVRSVPQPLGDDEKALAERRDRQWMDRCRPVIRQDRYGIARYRYAAPGCEFGVVE